MRKVLYWRNSISDITQFKEYSKTIDKLLNGEYSQIGLEKLHVPTKTPIYSIRHSKSTRILFTTYQNQICILEPILNHDYAKSRFLKNRHCLSHFFEKMEEEIITSAVESLDIPSYKDTSVEEQYIDFQQHFIALSTEQEETLNTTFPFILNGPAGSGKTMIAISLLQKLQQQRLGRALYITASSNLKTHIQNLWREMHDSHHSNQIQFLTYTEFLTEVLHVNSADLVDAQHFNHWYQGLKKCPFEQIKLEQEFRIISGYSDAPEVYLKLGEHQSLFCPTEREEIVKLFQLYAKALNSHLSLSLSRFKGSDSEGCFVIVDEAQDLSYAQLATLIDYGHRNTAILLGDHQVLYDGISRSQFVKDYFYQQAIRYHIPTSQAVNTVSLNRTYRCASHVSLTTNDLIRLKYQVTGGKLDKTEVTEMAIDHGKDGSVEWLDAPPEILTAIKHHHFKGDCAIINFSEDTPESFNNPMLFTPQDIKGLEFDTIILWKPFENLPASLAESLKQNLSSETKAITHRAKAGRFKIEHLNYFNELITSFTRAKKRLVIVHPQPQQKRNRLAEEIQKICSPISSFEENELAIDEQTWLEKIITLLSQGFEEKAKSLFLSKLKQSTDAFEAFKRQVLRKPEPISVNSDCHLSVSASATNLVDTQKRTASKQKTSKDLQQQILIEDAVRLLNTQFNPDTFSEIVSKYSDSDLIALFKIKIDDKHLIIRLGRSPANLDNLMLCLSINPRVFTKIAQIAQELLNLIGEKGPLLSEIFKLMLLDKNIDSLLVLAAIHHHHDLLENCLMAGAPPNYLYHTITVIHFALKTVRSAEVGLKTLRILKKYHADFGAPCQSKINPLSIAQGNLGSNNEIANFLLKETNFDISDELKYLVRLALEQKNIELLLLFKNHSNQSLFEKYIYSSFLCELNKYNDLPRITQEKHLHDFFVRWSFYIDVLEILDLSLSKPLPNGYQILHIAAENNRFEILNLLRQKGVDLSEKVHKSSMNAFSLAIKEGHFETVAFLLNHGFNPSELLPCLRSPVGLAAKNNRIKLLELLAGAGASLNQSDGNGYTPVMYALTNKHPEAIHFLLSRKVKLDGQNMIGSTLAHIAAEDNNLDFLAHLIQHDAPLNLINQKGYTPLHLAILKNHELMAVRLIEANLDDLVIESPLGSPLNLAILEKMPLVIDMLIKKKAFSNIPGLKHSPLHLALVTGDLQVIKQMIEGGINPDLLDNLSYAPIHLAAKHNFPKISKYLIDKGVQLNSLSIEGLSPLMLACQEGWITNVTLLLQAGVDVNLKNPFNHKTAIHYLIEKSETTLLQYLIDAGADINVEDNCGNTPLIYAVNNERFNSVQILLKNGAAINHRNHQGRTALILATKLKQIEILQALVSHGADVSLIDNEGNNLLHHATMSLWGNAKFLLHFFCEKGLDINAVNGEGENVFMFALKMAPMGISDLFEQQPINFNVLNIHSENLLHYAKDHFFKPAELKAFVDNGVNLEQQNDQGITPLLKAFKNNYFKLFGDLRTIGANIFVQDNEGNNLLHLAAIMGNNYYISLCLGQGFDIEAKNHLQETALYIAIKYKQIDAFKLLINYGANKALDAKFLAEINANDNAEFLEALADEPSNKAIINFFALPYNEVEANSLPQPLKKHSSS